MNPLILIPARGGSKGIPGKNIKYLNNKPLIQYTIDAARGMAGDEDICVSTDSNEIKNVVEDYGLKVPFIRPDFLAEDSTGTFEVALHSIDFYQKMGRIYDTLIILQPTSPFRSTNHILEAMALYRSDLDMVVSVREAKVNPYYALFEEYEDGLIYKLNPNKFTRRQNCPKVWEFNGAVYIINIKSLESARIHEFRKIKKYEMNEFDSVDIDTPMQWKFAEFLIKTYYNC